MKRFLLLFAITLSFWAVSEAQTIVSTEPSNRNVVLEEYTGIYCGYCPDGHRIANAIEKANEGRVFPINIHTTSDFSTPQMASHPDFRTTQGDELSQPSGVSSYPSGSINRSTTPWVMSRSAWESKVNSILPQASPVNIGVEAVVNPATRELTVKVEYYYTADEENPTNKLTVVLNQNEIIGYQASASTNPDFVTADGLYRHQHAFRMALTESVWGDVIPVTTAGTFKEKIYTVILPETIKNIPVDITELEVVAFIAPEKANIITAAGAKVDIPAENKVMLALEDQTVLPTDWFFDTFNPVVKVTNEFDTEVTQFDVIVSVNGTDYTETFTGSLAKGASTVVDFGDLDASVFTGNYTVSISGFDNINNTDVTGHLIVDWTKNDNSSGFSGMRFNRNAFSKADFSFEGKLNNVGLDFSENPKFQIASGVTGANNTSTAVLFYLHGSWGNAGKPANLIFGEANLSVLTDATISYSYAYSDGTFGGTAPTIKVLASDNDGDTWMEVNSIVATQTNIGSNSALYIPAASSEYLKETVDLKDYVGKNVLLKLSVIPGTSGNACWIDEVSIDGTYGNVGTVSVDTKQVNFGTITVSTYEEKEVTVSNAGTGDLTISSILIKEDDDSVFELVDVENGITLAAGASTKIKIKFTPKIEDLYLAELVINTNDPEKPVSTVSLVGEGEGNSVADEFISNSTLKIMPNPVATTASLVYNFTGTNVTAVDYTLADVTGKTVANLGSAMISAGENNLKFDVSNLSAGKYFLVITANNSAVQQVPVVVEK